jgi:type IV pilus assembly protein PilC
MAHFSYTAEKNDGEIYKGVAEANDRFELYQIVRREGGRIVSINEDSNHSKWSFQYWNSRIGSVKQYDVVLFARNLGAMLSAGLSLARALSVLERQASNKKLASVVSELAGDVRRGDALHIALAKYPQVFPKLMVAMARAGEEGGDLAQSLSITSDQLERMHDLKKKVRGAMLYPCIILVAIIGIGILMMVKVVPTLAQTFEEMNAELPQSTQVVIGISNFLINNTVAAIVIVAMLGVGLYLMVRTKKGQRVSDWIFIHLPLIGPMVKEVNAARTARTLASLSSSGVDVLTSLEITQEVVQNTYFRDVLKVALASVGEGEPLSATFIRNEQLYPAFVGEMMSVGEETGQTAEMLKRLAIYYEAEVDRKTKDMSTIIEPFLMLIIGGAVGFFAVSMISPIYQLSEHI